METVYFYSSLQSEYGVLSNFAGTPLTLNYQVWPTAEHLFQALKFTGDADDYEYHEKIRCVNSPRNAAKLGKSTKLLIRSDWDKVKVKGMLRVIRLKAAQHESVVTCLKSTGDALLVEKSPTDYYWGCGAKETGLNMLGKLWMQVRAEL